jgi:Cupin-like domain
MDDQNIAMTYLNAEVPFVLRNLADIDATSRKWQQAGYLEQLLGRKRNKYGQVINSTTDLDDDDTVPLFLVHKSPNYKFVYWKLEDGETYTDENAWSPPTEQLRMSFADYRKLTQKKQSSSNVKRDGDDDDDEKDQPHYYLYADGFWKRNDNDNDNDDSNDAKRIDSQLHRWHLFHELPRFQLFDESLSSSSSSSSSMQYRPPDVFQELVNGEAFQKMLCKIGTRGNHADMHFDQGRNTIVLLTGRRRYLLAHPSTCPQWHLYNIPHPSYRHSMLDFENASSWDTTSSGGSSRIMMNEVILEPGDVLILPSYWFHSVVLLEDDSAQCNGWSTPTRTYRNVIESCGSFLRQQ